MSKARTEPPSPQAKMTSYADNEFWNKEGMETRSARKIHHINQQNYIIIQVFYGLVIQACTNVLELRQSG